MTKLSRSMLLEICDSQLVVSKQKIPPSEGMSLGSLKQGGDQ
jgi:hypothetical protein